MDFVFVLFFDINKKTKTTANEKPYNLNAILNSLEKCSWQQDNWGEKLTTKNKKITIKSNEYLWMKYCEKSKKNIYELKQKFEKLFKYK